MTPFVFHRRQKGEEEHEGEIMIHFKLCICCSHSFKAAETNTALLIQLTTLVYCCSLNAAYC